MRQLRRAWMSLVLASVMAASARGNSPSPARWNTDPQQAWRSVQQTRRPLLVFVTRSDCLHCAKMRRGTLADWQVSSAIASGFVPLVLDGGRSSPLLNDLRVQNYPSTFVISPSAIILARWEGYLAPKALSERLSAVSGSRLVATHSR